LTEKSYQLASGDHKQFTFVVPASFNAQMVRKEIKKHFGRNATKVRIARDNRGKATKKAYVSLVKGQTIKEFITEEKKGKKDETK